MADVLITAPTSEPVSSAELRAHLRDPGDDDATLLRFIAAARSYIEEAASLALMTQTRRLTLDAWPGSSGGDNLGWWDGVRDGAMGAAALSAFPIGRGPLQSVASIKTRAYDGSQTTMDANAYYTDLSAMPGRLALAPGSSWPLLGRSTAGIEITYIAGYASASLIPPAIPVAILEIAAHRYENRGDDETAVAVPLSAARVIAKFRTGNGI